MSMENSGHIARDEIHFKFADLPLLKGLLDYLRPYKWRYAVSLGAIMLSATLVMLSARTMGRFIEEGLMAFNHAKAITFAITIIVLELTANLLTWFGKRILADVATKSIYNMRQALFTHINLLPMTYFDRQPQGRTVTRMTHDVESVESFFAGTLGQFIQTFILLVFALGAMLLTDLTLGVVLMLAMIPVLFFTVFMRERIRDVNRETSKWNSACNAQLNEQLNALPLIRALGLHQWATQKYEASIERHLHYSLITNFLYGWLRPSITFFCQLPLIMLLILAGPKVLAGTFSVGLFITFLRYCERFAGPLSNLAREFHTIQQAFTSAERIAVFLGEPKEDKTLGANGTLNFESFHDTLKIANLTMSYRTDHEVPVLKGVDLTIKAGEKIGLMGRTGSGKTTIITLLARLYEYQAGSITLDGQDLRQFRRESLRTRLGFVSQEVVIFEGSLRDNLVCDHQLEDEQILKACHQTGLAQILQQNGLTLDSQILIGGANLSLGEQQLIGLTRILLRDPLILILDEATSNIDPLYEAIILRAIDQVMQNRTCLMVAHRPQTLERADRILVFSEGQIIAQGSPQEILPRYHHHLKREEEKVHE